MGLQDKLDQAMSEEEFVIDFSAVKSNDFEPIPVGEYAAEIFEVEPGTSKAGNAKLVFKFRITEGEHEGRRFWKHVSHSTDGGKGMLKEVLKAIGEDVSGNLTVKPSSYVGRKCIIKVRNQKDQPDQQEVAYVKAAPEGRGTKLG